MKISFSKLSLLEKCERQFYYKYIKKLPYDANYIEPDFFLFGSIMHKILEISVLTGKEFEQIFDEIEQMEEFKSYISKLEKPKEYETFKGKMLLYYMLHKEFFNNNNFKILKPEVRYETNFSILIIDAVVEIDDKIYFFDYKTKTNLGSHVDATIARLHKDAQLCFYAFHADEVLHSLGISKKFGGVCYLEFAKTQHALLKNEKDYRDLANRLYADHEKLLRFIRIEDKEIDYETFAENFKLQLEKVKKFDEGYIGTQNYNACVDVFSGACPYFSQCYGNLSNENKHAFVSYGCKNINDSFLEGIL